MGWDESLVPDPNDPATFERSKLDWSELDEPAHARLLSLYRALARLRRDHAELTDPDQRGHAAESVGAGRWILHRDTASVYVNLSPEPWTVDLTDREVWLATTTAHEHLVDAGPSCSRPTPPLSSVRVAATAWYRPAVTPCTRPRTERPSGAWARAGELNRWRVLRHPRG
jgi:hypothetical protein